MLLLKNAQVYAPEPLGLCDLLVCNDKIVQMGKDLTPPFSDTQVLDLEGKRLVPGFIDQHVHSIGGGGEGGFHTRTPELKIEDAIAAGVTTLVGLLGTDSLTPSVESLVAKTKALCAEGITAYCLTGAYCYPSITLTGSVSKDIAYIQEVIGCKLALSDHRGSHPEKQDILALVSQIRLASLVSGKAGVLHMHIGPFARGIADIIELVQETDIPIKHFRPTHMGRHPEQAAAFTRMGGYADITASEKAVDNFVEIVENSDPAFLTLSSDSNGSMPLWNEKKEMVGIGIGKMTTLYEMVRALVIQKEMPLEQALSFITSHVAKALEIYPKKGCIAVGSDSDFVILDSDLQIYGVIACGKLGMWNGEILIRSTFSPT